MAALDWRKLRDDPLFPRFQVYALLILVARARKRGVEVGGREWPKLVAKWCLNEMDQAWREFSA